MSKIGINTEEEASRIIKEIEKDSLEVFSIETNRTLKQTFENLSKKITDILNGFKTVGLVVDEGKKVSNGMGINQISYGNEKETLSLALRAYSLIQELRKRIVRESLEYLLFFAGSAGGKVAPEMKMVSLKEMVPLVSILESTEKDLKLQISLTKKENISRRQVFKNLSGHDIQTELKENINKFYHQLNNIYYTRRKRSLQKAKNKEIKKYKESLQKLKTQQLNQQEFNKDFKNFSKTTKGFSYEAATVAALRYSQKGNKLEINQLLKIYKNQMGSAPFYTGGDIALNSQEMQMLLPNFKTLQATEQKFQLQLKNLTGSLGAQLASFDTIVQSLILIKEIVSANIPQEKIEKFLYKFFTNSKEKVSNIMNKVLNDVNKEVLKYSKK